LALEDLLKPPWTLNLSRKLEEICFGRKLEEICFGAKILN